VLVLLLLPLLGPPAAADPAAGSAGSAAARASALRAQVEALEHDVEVAAEDHADAADQLTSLVSTEAGAERARRAAQRAAEAEASAAGRRARALQRSGGRLELALGVVRGTEPADVLGAQRAVEALVGADARAVAAAGSALDRAVAASARVQSLRRQRQQLEAETGAAARRADDALAARTALLAAADAEVARLLLVQREEAERAATADAARTLARDLGADPAAPPAAGAGDPRVAAAIAAARTRLGLPYVWGATGPDTFDCSGLVQWAYRQAGVQLPRTTRQQYAALPRVPLDELAPGDLVLYADGPDPASIHHVGLVVGDGLMVHAPRTGDVVREAAIGRRSVYAAVRPVPAPAPAPAPATRP